MGRPKIKTQHAAYVEFKVVDGGDKGFLQFAEAEKDIPFPIKRTMVISGVKKGLARGAHGHKKFDQVLVAVRGSVTLGLDDGTTKQDILLDSPKLGVRMKPKLWHTMSNFSDDAVLLVFASHHHDEADYIRNYDEFLRFIRENP